MSLSGSPRYLIIRRDNIGDLVCTTPFISALRERHPNAYIAALVNSYNREILDGNPDIDEVFAYTKAKHRGPARTLFGVMVERIRMLCTLRRCGIDLAILAAPGFQKRSLRMARWAGAKQVLGFVGHEGEGNVELGVANVEAVDLHEVEAVFRLGAAIGIHGDPPRARIFPDPKMRSAVDEKVRLFLALRQGPIIGIHISARKPSQRWPAERFAALSQELSNTCNARVLLFWSPGGDSNALHPGDDAKAESIINACGEENLLAVPTTRLADLIAAVAACDMVICADGGAMHIAAALRKHIVCLFGDSSASRWRPWGTHYELLQSGSRNVMDIEVEQVVMAALKLIDATNAKNYEPNT